MWILYSLHSQRISVHMVCICLLVYYNSIYGAGIGVNWGNMASHRLPDKTVVDMIIANGISKVKLFDADPKVLKAFRGTDVSLMIGIPNNMLEVMATIPVAAQKWVKENVTQYMTDNNGVNIRYVAVGNEPFLEAYNGTYLKLAYPALTNVQRALRDAGFDQKIKATIPFNGDVLSNGNSTVPSGGIFRPDISEETLKIVNALAKTKAPFVVNLYPFLSLQQDPNFPKDFAFFDGTKFPLVDGNITYTNVLDASVDLLVAALTKEGHGSMHIIVGEIGWPTDGDINANVPNAHKFNQALVKHVLKNGTPLRKPPLDVYLFGLLDEDQKTILPGNFERHWGIFEYDGRAKYQLDLRGNGNNSVNLVNAKSVKYLPKQWCVLNPEGDLSKLGDNIAYACSNADCTPLMYGSSCNQIGGQGNASYAFNSYYQINDQVAVSCHFDGLAMVTTESPSTRSCEFKIQIATKSSTSSALVSSLGANSRNLSLKLYCFIDLLLLLFITLAVF